MRRAWSQLCQWYHNYSVITNDCIERIKQVKREKIQEHAQRVNCIELIRPPANCIHIQWKCMLTSSRAAGETVRISPIGVLISSSKMVCVWVCCPNLHSAFPQSRVHFWVQVNKKFPRNAEFLPITTISQLFSLYSAIRQNPTTKNAESYVELLKFHSHSHDPRNLHQNRTQLAVDGSLVLKVTK